MILKVLEMKENLSNHFLTKYNNSCNLSSEENYLIFVTPPTSLTNEANDGE